MNMTQIEQIARELRGTVIELTHQAKPAHLASALSCIDILAVLYWSVLNIDPAKPLAEDRDRFILSKGHAALALYSVLAKRGFCSNEILQTFNNNGGKLAEHPGPQCIPGVEAATGSLGHGLPIGNGLALRGFRPVCEIMFGDFLALAADQLINHAAKFRYMYNDQVTVPLE